MRFYNSNCSTLKVQKKLKVIKKIFKSTENIEIFIFVDLKLWDYPEEDLSLKMQKPDAISARKIEQNDARKQWQIKAREGTKGGNEGTTHVALSLEFAFAPLVETPKCLPTSLIWTRPNALKLLIASTLMKFAQRYREGTWESLAFLPCIILQQ